MKNNIICIISLYIVSILVLTTFTLFNKHFVKYEFDKHNYYNLIYKNITKDLDKDNLDYNLDIKDVKRDLDEYIDSKYSKTFNTKIDSKKDTKKLYNKHISFDHINMSNKNIKIYIIEIVTIIFIFITGDIFIKTKKKNNVFIIFLVTGILLINTSLVLYIINNIKNEILFDLINKYIHFILGYGIIVIEIAIFNKYKIFDKIICKKK